MIGQIQNAKSVHTLFHFDSKTIILRKKFQRCVKSLTNYDSLFFFSQSNSTEKSWLWLVILSNQMKNQSKLWGYTGKPNLPFLDINLMRTNKYMIYRYEVNIFFYMQTQNKVCWFACKLQMKTCQYRYMLNYRVQLQILIVSIISEPWNIQILFNTYLSNPSTP